MLLTEQRQKRTDEEFAQHEVRQSLHRFATTDDSTPKPATRPKRYRFFTSGQQAYADPIIGPLMAEEDEREREGLPPRFSLL